MRSGQTREYPCLAHCGVHPEHQAVANLLDFETLSRLGFVEGLLLIFPNDMLYMNWL